MNPVTQKVAPLCGLRHQQALGVAALPGIYIPLPRVAEQYLVLYKVQHTRKSKQNLR